MEAQVRKEKVSLKTYPFADPAPVPEFGRLYPYNRFDGYTDKGTDVLWDMIVMENDFIKVWINPSVGGKVWGAIEKSTGKEFIYFNHAAKFRDVAMRGPWTSGGLEFNIGIIGHSPSCSAKVDHHFCSNADGSVSCFIGATDWPSRTRWYVEISLGKDAAFFTTRTSWYNNSSWEQAYYNWSNAGIKTTGGLEYVFPGSSYLGHDGKLYCWPKDTKERDLSFYENNNFGHYKSYHVTGAYSGFWGCYWHRENFGLGHYSDYDQKPGKKIWIWGLSRYGMIWEDLLTDKDGQYTEVQSGRLFNQSIARSSRTPFKHRSFSPYTFDTWNEYWFPVKETGGLNYACPQLSFYISNKEGGCEFRICANQPLDAVLAIKDKEGILFSGPLSMQTMENLSIPMDRIPESDSLELWLDDMILYKAVEQEQPLKRPQEIAAGYHYDSVEGIYFQAKEWERQRFFEWAAEKYEACLARDPFYTKALAGLAGLRLRFMDASAAYDLLFKALSIDAYDGGANYLYGLTNNLLGNTVDAKEAFSIAGQSPEYRVAAFTELAKIFIREKQFSKADSFLEQALAFNTMNCQAIQLKIFIKRKMNLLTEAHVLATKQLLSDPLDHLVRFELSKAGASVDADLITGKITSELPYETYLEIASFYVSINAWEDAFEILSLSPEYPMVELWKAYLCSKTGQPELAATLTSMALLAEPAYVFPHRFEDAEVLQWAMAFNGSWKLKYYLALVFLQTMRKEQALELLNSCGNEPLFYPFYQVRAGVRKGHDQEGALADLIRAYEVAPKEWRTSMQLSKYYSENAQWEKALGIAGKGYLENPENYFLGLHLARCLMQMEKFEEGIVLMKQLNVLPNEGASEGRNVWRETNLHAAISAIQQKNWSNAFDYIRAARTWPENIGVGKPYEVDERLEDFLERYCLLQQDADAEESTLSLVEYRGNFPETPFGSNDLLSILVIRNSGESKRAAQYMEQWLNSDQGDLTAARWAKSFLEGDREMLELLSVEKVEVPVALPYEIPYEDREFVFVKKLYSTKILTNTLTTVM